MRRFSRRIQKSKRPRSRLWLCARSPSLAGIEAVSGTLVCSEERPRKVDSCTCAALGNVHNDAAVQLSHSKKQADLAAAWHGEVLRGSIASYVVTARRSRAVLMAGVAACALALSCRNITRGLAGGGNTTEGDLLLQTAWLTVRGSSMWRPRLALDHVASPFSNLRTMSS
jgi:hypothetical protein